MINQFPRWKNWAIAIFMMVAFLYALPNIFGDNPAIQISTEKGAAIDDFVVRKMKSTLDDAKIPYTLEQNDHAVLIRFKASDEQLAAQSLLAKTLGDSYIVALNLAPATPEWMKKIGAKPMKLGLDLRGGVHFLMQVDMADVEQRHLDGLVEGVRSNLRDEKIRYRALTADAQGILIRLATPEDAKKAVSVLHTSFPELIFTQPEPLVTQAILSPTGKKTLVDDAMDQTMMTLRNRVNELGVAEAVVQRQGLDRVVVELPGVQDTAYAKQILGTTASVAFYLLSDEKSIGGGITFKDRQGLPQTFDRAVVLSGDNIVGARSGFDQYGKPAVFIQIGGNVAAFSKITGDNVGRGMGTVFTETRYHDAVVNGVPTRVADTTREVINVATINQRLDNHFQISPMSSPQEARNLALLLRAGAFPAPVDYIEERIIGPSMGEENIKKGVISLVAGLALVLGFMMCYYSVFGIISNIALLMNLVLLVAVLSLLGATLTLPSMAAIVLTLGMAVDANVLIFERIREELRHGQTGHGSIHAGYEKAFLTIVDANITTLIAAIALFSIGSGPIKGFAITLIIGLITSVFTGVTVSRAIVNLIFGGKRLSRLPIGMSDLK